MDWSALTISIKTALTATAATLILGLLAAKFVVRVKGFWKGLLDVVFTLPMILPPTVAGYLLLIFFGRGGPAGQLLDRFGLSVVFSWSATVIAAAVVSFPLMYRAARGAFEQIDSNLYDAARTLGVSEIYIFWKITIPIALPGILGGVVLAFARALGEFGATMMLSGNIPGKTQTIPMAIYSSVMSGDLRGAAIWVALMIALSLVMIMLMNHWGRRPLSSRGEVYD
jgi:molybdate transport system permease protein